MNSDMHLGHLAQKVRARSPYSFANINLLGRCNVDCYFCLGKDLETQFAKFQTLKQHFFEWPNFSAFVAECKKLRIPQIYITGQNTDSLLYNYLQQLIDYLKADGFFVGLRTNGLLAEKRINVINQCSTCWGDAVSYSVHTLSSETQNRIMKVSHVPNWDKIIRSTKVPLRIAIVITRFNVAEFNELIKFLSQYDNVSYIQVRRICTDSRYDDLSQDMELFENLEKRVAQEHETCKIFETAKSYKIHGKEVNFWRTVATTVNSLNYFTDGTLSDNYFVIEGYSDQNKIPRGSKKYLTSLWNDSRKSKPSEAI